MSSKLCRFFKRDKPKIQSEQMLDTGEDIRRLCQWYLLYNGQDLALRVNAIFDKNRDSQVCCPTLYHPIAALELLVNGAKAAAIITPIPSLDDAIKAALFLIDCAQGTQSNHYEMKQLASTVGECVLTIYVECSMTDANALTGDEWNIKNLTSKIQDVGLCCERLSHNNPLSKDFRQRKHAEELRWLKDEIHNAFSAFSTHTQISQLKNLNEISKIGTQHDILPRIPCLPLLEIDPKTDCLGRDGEVNDVSEWLVSGREFAYWITGIIGVGKTTFARDLAAFLEAGDRLACLVDLTIKANVDLSPSSLIEGMAHHLAILHPSCRDTIANEAQRKTSNTECVGSIFERYLYKPIKMLNPPAPLVFVVHALDKWSQCTTFLKGLNEMHRDCIRFIFASCARNDIGNALQHLSYRNRALQGVSDSVIKSYLVAELNRLRLGLVDEDHVDIDSLVEQAQGLFVWADTICESLGLSGTLERRRVRLKKIVSSPREALSHHSYLWALYNHVLSRSCRDPNHDSKTLCKVLTAMSNLQSDVSIKSFCQFANVAESDVEYFHDQLQAFYRTQSKKDTISPLHLTTHFSFRDFLFAPDINDEIAHPFVIKREDRC